MANLSPLARQMLWNNGVGRLKLMLSEYEAGLPPTMPTVERMERMAAIKEILTNLAAPVKTKKK